MEIILWLCPVLGFVLILAALLVALSLRNLSLQKAGTINFCNQPQPLIASGAIFREPGLRELGLSYSPYEHFHTQCEQFYGKAAAIIGFFLALGSLYQSFTPFESAGFIESLGSFVACCSMLVTLVFYRRTDLADRGGSALASKPLLLTLSWAQLALLALIR